MLGMLFKISLGKHTANDMQTTRLIIMNSGAISRMAGLESNKPTTVRGNSAPIPPRTPQATRSVTSDIQ